MHEELVERIETALADAWNGDEGWGDLELSGSDQYFAACEVVEIVRAVQRMLSEGSAPPALVSGVRGAFLDLAEGEVSE